MRFKNTAGLVAATVLAIGALSVGCDSGKPSEKGTGESGSAGSTEGGRPANAPVTGTGLSTTGVGAGVGTGGGTGTGLGRTGYDGTVNATSEPTTESAPPKTGAAATEPTRGESSAGASKSGSEKSSGKSGEGK